MWQTGVVALCQEGEGVVVKSCWHAAISFSNVLPRRRGRGCKELLACGNQVQQRTAKMVKGALPRRRWHGCKELLARGNHMQQRAAKTAKAWLQRTVVSAARQSQGMQKMLAERGPPLCCYQIRPDAINIL